MFYNAVGDSVDPSFPGHVPLRNIGNKPRLCALCQMNKVKTRSGWKAYTRFHCAVCEINLCTGERGCFVTYHKKLAETFDHGT